MNVTAVLCATANVFDVTVAAMCSRSRRRQVLQARQVAMYILRKHGNMSYADIGCDFDRRSHATVLHGVKKIERILVVFNERIEKIMAEVNKMQPREPMRYNMQLGVELRCGKCQDALSTDNHQAVCLCENLKIKRLMDPFTRKLCALVEAMDDGTVEAQRRDGEWVPLEDAISWGEVRPPHIGQATEIMMRSAIEFWEYSRETHKRKADVMSPLTYWKEYNTLILGFPRISGSTTAALKLAGERGLFAYFARDWTVANRVRASQDESIRAVFTSPEGMDEELRGLAPMTFVFDGVIKTPAEWDEILEFCTICAAAMDHTEVLILRIGEAL